MIRLTSCSASIKRHLRANNVYFSRNFLHEDSKTKLARLSLREPFPISCLPSNIKKSPAPITLDVETKVTRLSNGLRVASENRPGLSCTIGLAIQSGCRYEAGFPVGVSQMLEKLAFRSTSEFAEKTDMLLALEKNEGICDAQISRDMVIYAASCSRAGVPIAINVLAEAALRPLFRDMEIEQARQLVAAEFEDMCNKPDQENQLQELAHAAAFSRNTLGLPRYSHPDSVAHVTREHLYRFCAAHHTFDRIVLGGVGIEHDQLVELAERIVSAKRPIWLELLPKEALAVKPDQSFGQYTGGYLKIDRNLRELMVGPAADSLPEAAHVVLGLESVSHQEQAEFVPLCVLQTLMGGGGSFSAGGPGKGMYSRLYLNVLNRHHWVQNASAHNWSYADTGLFGIHGATIPQKLRDLLTTMIRELVRMRERPSPDEFLRAKTQLQSLLLMNLEQRPAVLEDICRQVLVGNSRRQPQYWFDLIGKVTEEDVQRVASRLLSSRLTVAAVGRLDGLPSYSEIQAILVSENERANSQRSGKQVSQVRRLFTGWSVDKNVT